MNKEMVSGSVMLALCISMVAGAAVAGPKGSCLVARSGGDYTTIGAAVEAAACRNAVIDVLRGVYRENIVLRAGQTLRGAGRSQSTIDAADAAAPVVVAVEDTTIEGFSINGGTAGVFANCSACKGKSKKIRVLDNDIAGGSRSGVEMTQYANGEIENNEIHDTPYGVRFDEFSNPSVKNNVIGNVNVGVYFENGKAFIERNWIATKGGASDVGIYGVHSSAHVNHNVVDNFWRNKLSLSGKHNVTLSGKPVGP